MPWPSVPNETTRYGSGLINLRTFTPTARTTPGEDYEGCLGPSYAPLGAAMNIMQHVLRRRTSRQRCHGHIEACITKSHVSCRTLGIPFATTSDFLFAVRVATYTMLCRSTQGMGVLYISLLVTSLQTYSNGLAEESLSTCWRYFFWIHNQY